MKREVRDQWIADLEYGKFKQGFGQLKSIDERYCCLGVLAEQLGLLIYDENGYYYVGYSVSRFPHPEQVGLSERQQRNLIRQNDLSKYNFLKIANWIRNNIEVKE